MNRLDIVISYYNNTNFLKLLSQFSNDISNIIIYNKSEKKINLTNYKQIFLQNKGREAETYLNHIINNYDNLNDFTLFIQDDTNNHIPNYNNFIQFCNNFITNNLHFSLYPCSWRENKPVVLRTIKNGSSDLHTLPSKDSIKKCCEKHNINLPPQYTTQTCAFFICNKNAILNHNKEFYIKLKDWLLENDKNVYVLEHIWLLLFSYELNKNY